MNRNSASAPLPSPSLPLVERPMKEVTRNFTGLLIGPVLVIAGLLLDSSWHATGHTAHLVAQGYLLWFLGLIVILFASVRMFLAHIALARGVSTGGRYRLKSIRTATLGLYIGIAGAGLLLLGGLLDTWWHHIHREELDVFSPLHPYHSLVLVGLVAIVAAGLRLFTSQAELSVDLAEAQSSSSLATGVTPAPSGPLTILFTDIEGSTALDERLGDQRWMELLRAHNALVREQVQAHGGFEVKFAGDSFMVAFQSARRALQCAIAIQRAFAQQNETAEEPIRVRIGLHTGEAIKQVDDFYGRHVNLAWRIADEAKGGEILVSSLVKELTDNVGDIEFGEGLEVELKGLQGKHRVFKVGWQTAAPVYPAGLTDRELEVLRLIAAGKTNKEIAEELVISLNTVARHVSNIFVKTGVANRAGAATYAAQHRLGSS